MIVGWIDVAGTTPIHPTIMVPTSEGLHGALGDHRP
jgi:hypothetical protein